MFIDDYARYQAATGARVMLKNSTWWRCVRPFFFRPVFPFFTIEPRECCPPTSCMFGAAQYAVRSGDAANSHINVLVFENAGDYRLAALPKNVRYQVRKAADTFVIRRVDDPEMLASEGHRVYVSFLERTSYAYRCDRRRAGTFAQWARAIMQFPVRVLGGFRGAQLAAISVSCLVDETLCYETFFCDSESLRGYVSDLMLHRVREQAAESPRIKRIFAGMAGMGRGLDSFYHLRGASAVSLPARLQGNPFVLSCIKVLMPREHRKLIGVPPGGESMATAGD
jgi:hypothetical protein